MKGEAIPNFQMDQISKFGRGTDCSFANLAATSCGLRPPGQQVVRATGKVVP